MRIILVLFFGLMSTQLVRADEATFDSAISTLQTQIDSKETALELDPDNVKLKALQAKATELQILTAKRTDAENKKAKFVSIKNQIDTKTQEISALEQQASDLEASIE